MNTKKLAALLNAYSKGKNAAQLSREMGINAQSLRGYLRNDGTRPSMETMGAISAYFGMSIDELLAEVSDEPVSIRAKESCSPYKLKIASFEELTPFIDNLPDAEKKRVAIYATQAIAV